MFVPVHFGHVSTFFEVGSCKVPVPLHREHSKSISGNARAAYDFGENLPTFGLAGSFLGRRLADGAYGQGFTPTPKASPQVDIRATLSGKVAGMSYRVTADYAITDHGPYVIGAVNRATADSPSAELNPIQQFTGYLEVGYEF